MNEEIEYAEMLEIPVSTVNVVRKPRKRKKSEQPSPISTPTEPSAIKDTVIASVNERVLNNTEENSGTQDAFPYSEQGEGVIYFDLPEKIDTVRLYSVSGDREGLQPDDYALNEGGMYAMNAQPKAVNLALRIEFGLACALCGAIFLTNVFMPGSAINTFFRALNNPATDTIKQYSDFTLSAVVSELSDAELTLSPTGILSLTDECHIYPIADGKVGEITQNEDGLYTMKVCYSDSFTGVFSGLNSVYYNEGDSVKTNVPIGYTAGEKEVQVTMYSDGLLLNCYEITEENCLAWISGNENS